MTWTNKLTFFLVCFTTIFVTIAYGGVHQPILALFYILVGTASILTLIDALQVGALRFDPSMLQLPLYGIAVYGFIQAIPFGKIADVAGLAGVPRTISADPFSSEVNALHLLILALFFSVLLIALDTYSRIRKMVYIVIIFGFLFSFFAILQSFLSPNRIYGIYESRFAMPFGSFVNRHNFAAFIEMCLCLPLGMLFSGSVTKDRRLLFITALSLMGIALILSGSRGGLVAMVAGFIMVVVLTRRGGGRKQVAMKAALAASLLIVVIGGAIFVGGESSLSRFVETAQSKDISTNRFYIWTVTTKVIVANLPFGAGLGALGVAFTPFDTNSGLERVEQAHNDYLQALSDAGLVGGLLGALFLYFLIVSGAKAVRTENLTRRGIAIGAIAGCVAVLVHSLFDFVLHTTAISMLFLILLGLIVAAGRKYPDDVRNEKHSRRRRKGTVTEIAKVRHVAELEN